MKSYIVRVDTNPPLYFGPFTREQARQASGDLQERFMCETGTYMMLNNTDADHEEAAAFNDPNYEE